MSAQPKITQAKLLCFQTLEADADVLGTLVHGDKTLRICHDFVYAYLEAKEILVRTSGDSPSKIYGNSGFSLVAGFPQAGDIILLGKEAHSMIVLAPDIWVGVNNMGFFAYSLSHEEAKCLHNRCVLRIVDEDLSKRTINLMHYPSNVSPVPFEVYRHTGYSYPPFEMSQLSAWQPVPSEEDNSGCCTPM